MSRWSSIASGEPAAWSGAAVATAPTQRPAQGFNARTDLPFDAPLERPATTPSPARPDPRRTLNLETSPTRLDLVIEILLVALLAFMPVALGVVAPWSEMVVVITTAAIGLCLALRVALHRHGAAGGRRFSWSWSYVPMVLFVAVAGLQLLSLPSATVGTLSPQTLALKSELLADSPGGTALGRTTLSFYPFAAGRDLRLIAVAATLFIAVVNTFHRAAQVKRLLGAIAAMGGAVALLALLQDVTGTDCIFWLIPTPPGSGMARSGPFINHNHFAQFMNLSIGAALALLLVRLREELPLSLTPTQVFDRLQDPDLRGAWWLAAVVVVGAVTVLLSLSRGGMVGMVAAAGFMALMLAWRRGLGGGGWAMAIVGLFVFMAVLYVGFDAVADRLATLHKDADPTAGRTQVYKDVAVVARKFPLLGMGLGTWEVTYPMFDRSTIALNAEYADSDYAQALHETGAAGLGVVVLFAAIVWANFARATRATRVPACAAAFGLAYGLIAVMVQGATDYGQHMPAIAGLTAVTCGLLVVLGQKAAAAAKLEPAAKAAQADGAASAVGQPRQSPARRLPAIPAAAASVALPIVLLAGLAWALLNVNAVRVAEGHIARAERVARRLEADGWQGSNDQYVALLAEAWAAADRQPANVEYRYWLNAYRWRSISRTTDPQSGDLLMADRQLQAADRIVGELHAAATLCPTFGPVRSLAGQLEMLVLDRPEEGAAHVRLGQRLAPTDPAATFAVASVDAAEGNWDESLAKFRHCLALNANLMPDVIAVYAAAGRSDLALAVAGDDPAHVQRVIVSLNGQAPHTGTVTAAEDKLLSLLSTEKRQAAAPAYLLGSAADLCYRRGSRAVAIEYYRRALGKDYDRVDWRLSLARCLAAEGRAAEAMREAKLCMRLKPRLVEARALVEELSVKLGPNVRPASPAVAKSGRRVAAPE
jgi:O-antigen ligase/tetratricopeptide (TPR) repeat protein